MANIQQDTDDPSLKVGGLPELMALLPGLADTLLHRVFAVTRIDKLRVADFVHTFGHTLYALCELLLFHLMPFP
jgi:hypothetical protein